MKHAVLEHLVGHQIVSAELSSNNELVDIRLDNGSLITLAVHKDGHIVPLLNIDGDKQ